VTKLRPGLQTMTRAAVIFMAQALVSCWTAWSTPCCRMC
jgi:hypothetical protein